MKKIIICLIVAAFLAGCASPAQVGGMIARRINVTKATENTTIKNRILLNNVSGGSETSPHGVSKVADADFKLALEKSLKNARLLSNSVDNNKYLLEVVLINLVQPLFGVIDYTVTAIVSYTLKTKYSGQIIYSKTVATPFTVTFSDSAIAVDRMRIANEGAIRNNIEQVIDDLLSVKVDEHAVIIR